MSVLLPIFLAAATSLPIGSVLMYAVFNMVVVFAVLFVIFLLIRLFTVIIARFIENGGDES